MSISKIFIPNSLCVFSQIKDRKHIEQNFHSVARVMRQGWDLWVLGGVKNFSVGICDGAPSTARSSLLFVFWFDTMSVGWFILPEYLFRGFQFTNG